MENANICNRCGHENPERFKYCNNCGKSATPQIVAKEFPTLVEIHEDANLDRVAMHLFEDARYVPTVQELREAMEILNVNRQQVYIRVMSLDLPGVQARRTFTEVARERNGSSSAVKYAFDAAYYDLRKALIDARRQELYRLRAEEDLATVAE